MRLRTVRRSVVLVLLGVILMLAGCGGAASICPHVDPGSARPSPSVVPLGVAVDWPQVRRSPRYDRFIVDHYTWVTPENELKMDALEPDRGQFAFGTADAIVDWALRHGKRVHGHVLIYGQQLPSWLASAGTLSPAAALRVMRTYIDTVLHHFRGRVGEWDVVNEAFNPSGGWKHTLWYRALGPAYVIDAFRLARAAAPGVRLCYNDGGIETVGAHAADVLALTRVLRSQGLLDCIGFESHFVAPGPTEPALATEIRRFAATGVQVLISELDVQLTGPATLTEQAQTYANVATACRTVHGCARLTTWGFTDADSWLGRSARALPFDTRCEAKPAWTAVEQALRRSPSP